MHRFDYSFLETASFPADIVSKASRIESMRGREESVIRSHPAVVSDSDLSSMMPDVSVTTSRPCSGRWSARGS